MAYCAANNIDFQALTHHGSIAASLLYQLRPPPRPSWAARGATLSWTGATGHTHELAEGTDLVKNIVAHRLLANGTYDFLVEWVHDPIQSWMGGQGLTHHPPRRWTTA